MYDLLIRNATLIDPAQGLRDARDVAFSAGRVAVVAETIAPDEARQVIDGAGKLLTPGWIDLHVHVFDGVSHLGIPPDPNCIAKGVTTAVDAGSAGADTFPGFRKYVIEVSDTRLYAQLNISSQGMLSPQLGEFDDIRWVSVDRTLQVIEALRLALQEYHQDGLFLPLWTSPYYPIPVKIGGFVVQEAQFILKQRADELDSDFTNFVQEADTLDDLLGEEEG
jgi:predicted amidohydrolase